MKNVLKSISKDERKEISKRLLIGLILVITALIMTVFALMINTAKANVLTNYALTVFGLWTSVSLIFISVYIYLLWSHDKREIALPLGSTCGIAFVTIVITTLTSCVMSKYINVYSLTFLFAMFLGSSLINKRSGFVISIASIFTFLLTRIAVYNIDKVNIFDADLILSTSIAFISILLTMVVLKKNFTRFKLVGIALIISTVLAAITLLSVLIIHQDVAEVFTLAGFQLAGNVIAVALFCATLPIFEVSFHSWTDFRLAEICSFNNPLIRRLSEEAPGTYTHSIAVANLMENCAVALNLNPFMARACGYYHDIGKLSRPQMFVENQKDGYNPHDELIPEVSASMIIQHTSQGVEILKKAKMPLTVINAAAEHHGDSEVQYFYLKAQVITEGKLDDEKYCYDGPRPTSKYSAMLMICDSIEAISRAKTFTDAEDLEKTVGGVIKDRLLDGQFDNCDITMLDLRLIKETVCQVLPANMHSRIDYNKAKENR